MAGKACIIGNSGRVQDGLKILDGILVGIRAYYYYIGKWQW